MPAYMSGAVCGASVCVCGDGVMLQWPSNAIIRGGHIYGSSIGSWCCLYSVSFMVCGGWGCLPLKQLLHHAILVELIIMF